MEAQVLLLLLLPLPLLLFLPLPPLLLLPLPYMSILNSEMTLQYIYMISPL